VADIASVLYIEAIPSFSSRYVSVSESWREKSRVCTESVLILIKQKKLARGLAAVWQEIVPHISFPIRAETLQAALLFGAAGYKFVAKPANANTGF